MKTLPAFLVCVCAVFAPVPFAISADQAQSRIIDEKHGEQKNVIPNPALELPKPPAAPASPAPPPAIGAERQAAKPRPAARPPAKEASRPAQQAQRRPPPGAEPRVRAAPGPNEAPLWKLLREERFAQLDAEISRLRKVYPGWAPPQQLVVLRREADLWRLLREERFGQLDSELAAMRAAYPRWSPPSQLITLRREAGSRNVIAQAIAARDWKRVTTLAQQDPAQFTCDRIDFMWGLAEAHQALGNKTQANAVYQRIIPACPKSADRIATLHKASAVVDDEAFAELLQRESQGGRRDAAQQAQLDQAAYDHRMRRFLQAVEAKNPSRAIELAAGLEPAVNGRRDAPNATLFGWTYFDAGKPDIAASWFGKALAWSPASEDARYGLALANFKMNRLDEAEGVMLQARATDARSRALKGEIAYARALKAYEDRNFARTLEHLSQAEAQGKTGRDMAMLRAWSVYQHGDDAQAVRLFTDLYRANPDRESAEGLASSLSRSHRLEELADLARSLGGPLETQWRAVIAQQFYGRKLFLAAEAAAPGTLPQLQNIATASVALGAMMREKSGQSGLSHLRQSKTPFVEGVATFGGTHELRLQLSRVTLDSGSLPARAMIGSFPAAGGYVTAPTTRLEGYEPQLSYRHQGWRTVYASLGQTPSGAVLPSTLFGNAGVLQQFERGNWRAEIFSQPVRESMLSYTGIVDPYSGQSWGRVRRSGLLLGGYTSLTERWGASGKVQAMSLQGRNVASNEGVALSLGLSRDLKLRNFDYFTIGPAVSWEAYRRNLSHFTFGHGGYYSPQGVLSVGVSSHFLTAEARQHILKGDFSLGVFNKREAASPCFPGGAAFPLNPACSYAGTRSTGTYYSAQLMGVKRLSDHVQLGGALVLRSSPQYDDKAVMVFLRFLMQPRPSVMSSDLPEGLLQSLF